MQVCDGTRAQRWAAAYTLQSLAWSALNRVPNIGALVELVSNSTDFQRENAGDALVTLAEVICTCTGDRGGALAEVIDSMLKAALAPTEAPPAAPAPAAPALAPPAKAPATCNVQS